MKLIRDKDMKLRSQTMFRLRHFTDIKYMHRGNPYGNVAGLQFRAHGDLQEEEVMAILNNPKYILVQTITPTNSAFFNERIAVKFYNIEDEKEKAMFLLRWGD